MAGDVLMPTLIKSEQQRTGSAFRFPNAEAKKMHTWVNAEVQDMIDYARPAREIGSDSIKGYMSVVHKAQNYKKDRSDIVFPLLHATIYSRQTLEAARAPQVKFTAQYEGDEPNLKWVEQSIKAALDGGPNRPPFDHVYFNQVFDKNLLGVGPVYVGYEYTTRMTHVRDHNGKWVEKRMVVEDDIRVRNVDFFNFGVSRDMATGMFDGRACYWDQFYDKHSFFAKFKENPFYMNLSEDLIPDGDWFMGTGMDTGSFPKPRTWKGIYRVRRFWDIVNDILYEQANGIPIRWDHILDYGKADDPIKMLPIATIHNDIAYGFTRPSALAKMTVQNNRFYTESSATDTNRSFWSKPEALIVKPMIAAQNTFGRSMVDWLKAASIHFVMGPTGVIDRINKGKLYGIEPIKLDAGDFNTKSLVQGSTFLQDFKVADDHLQKMSNAALGRDIFRSAGDMQAPPTTIAMQREMEQKRDAQNNRYNSTGGIVRMYWLMYILAQQYYPAPRSIKITDLGQVEDVDESRILRNADGEPVMLLEPKEIPVDFPVVEITKARRFKVKDPKTGNDIMRYEKKYSLVTPNHSEAIRTGAKGQYSFIVREDHFSLKKRPKISVIPLSTFQEDSAILKAASVETLNAITPFLTMAVDGKPLLPKEAYSYIVENFAKSQGWDVEKFRTAMNEGDAEAPDEDGKDILPPYADAQELAANPNISQAMGGMFGAEGGPPSAAGSGVPVQTAKMGSPPKPGSALNPNAMLASTLSM